MTLSLLQLVAFLLAGVLVRARRQAASLAARSAALERQAEQAAVAERARIARELHGTRARMWLRPGGLVATPGLTAQLEAGW